MLAGLGEGERLWVREVFTLIDAALVPRRDWLVSEGKDPVDGPVARLVSTTPKEVCRPQPDGKNYLGTLAGTRCLLLPPCQDLLPLVSWGICVACLPSLPPPQPRQEASAAGGNSPRAWQRSISLTGEPAQGKTSLCPPSTPSFSGELPGH